MDFSDVKWGNILGIEINSQDDIPQIINTWHTSVPRLSAGAYRPSNGCYSIKKLFSFRWCVNANSRENFFFVIARYGMITPTSSCQLLKMAKRPKPV